MKRITIRGISAVQIALLWESIEELTNWRVGWNKYNRKQAWISIQSTTPQRGTVLMRLGNLSEELLTAILIPAKQFDIVDSQIEVEDE